jgi:hypothetical protein
MTAEERNARLTSEIASQFEDAQRNAERLAAAAPTTDELQTGGRIAAPGYAPAVAPSDRFLAGTNFPMAGQPVAGPPGEAFRAVYGTDPTNERIAQAFGDVPERPGWALGATFQTSPSTGFPQLELRPEAPPMGGEGRGLAAGGPYDYTPPVQAPGPGVMPGAWTNPPSNVFTPGNLGTVVPPPAPGGPIDTFAGRFGTWAPPFDLTQLRQQEIDRTNKGDLFAPVPGTALDQALRGPESITGGAYAPPPGWTGTPALPPWSPVAPVPPATTLQAPPFTQNLNPPGQPTAPPPNAFTPNAPPPYLGGEGRGIAAGGPYDWIGPPPMVPGPPPGPYAPPPLDVLRTAPYMDPRTGEIAPPVPAPPDTAPPPTTTAPPAPPPPTETVPTDRPPYEGKPVYTGPPAAPSQPSLQQPSVTVPTPQGPLNLSITQIASAFVQPSYFGERDIAQAAVRQLMQAAQAGDPTAMMQLQMLDQMLT